MGACALGLVVLLAGVTLVLDARKDRTRDQALSLAWERVRAGTSGDCAAYDDATAILGEVLRSKWYSRDLVFRMKFVSDLRGLCGKPIVDGVKEDLMELDQRPGDPEASLRLAKRLTAAGELDKAASVIQAAQRARPDDRALEAAAESIHDVSSKP